MIKDMVVLLDPDAEVPAPYALSLAKQFGAHLTAVACAFEPSLPYFTTGASDDVIATAREAVERRAERCLDDIERRARADGLSVAATRLLTTPELASDEAVRLARYHDLTVLGQSRDSGDGRSVLAAVLLGSGRPLLVVPDVHQRPAALSRLVVAWDSGDRAARAVAGGLPLLGKAGTVEIVRVVDGDAAEADADLLALGCHLERHGIAAQTRKLWGEDPAETLLSHLADSGANLLVMGGYGRSRFREALFGGTTRAILDSMTAPVLMAH
jgi:nucleotide-binding universal stress UspA family protein